MHFDVLIVGAGLSGIAAARHLQMRCPDRTFTILEAREALGGTWDLFRYPGIRSDSDMHTMGFSFRPWVGSKTIADGSEILGYMQDTAREYDIDRTILFNRRVIRAEWSSQNAAWTVYVAVTGEETPQIYSCMFLFMCSGYYDYDTGYSPDFAGAHHFKGRIVHPQHWPQDLDYGNKRVILIGSGATAVTLVPAMARTADHVTMLQRSPSWFISVPSQDATNRQLRQWLPHTFALRFNRWKNILSSIIFFQIARRFPRYFSGALLKRVTQQLTTDFDVATHFTPRYKPWDQRLCLVPDGDLFRALRSGRAEIVTDNIERLTETGIQLASGRHLEADIIVTATGLKVQLLGGMQVLVDGQPTSLSETLNYKATMFSGIPNFALTVGYTNASWTLKAELSAIFVCRLLRYLARNKLRSAVPVSHTGLREARPIIDLSSGYIQRALPFLPMQGQTFPWKLYQNYPMDFLTMKYRRLNDGHLRFSR
jgi:monooxygenase